MIGRWLGLGALLVPLAGHAAPPDFAPAPVPNLDLTAPAPIDGDPGPTVSGRLDQTRIQLRSGDGYTPGSSFSEELERRSRGIAPGFAPMLSIKFPLN